MSEPVQPPSLSPPPPPPPPSGGAGGAGLPWEVRDGASGPAAFAETVKLLISEPAAAFARARRRGDLVPPLAYAVVISWFGVLAQQLWRFAFGRSLLESAFPALRDNLGRSFALSGVAMVVALVVTPIVVLVFLFIGSAIVHLFLLLFGATKSSESGFEGTLRALCWSTTAQLAQVVPFAGGLVALVWGIILQTLGLAELHRTTHGRALAAILAPLALCCVCLGAFFGVALAGILATYFGHHP
jgi:hypothetical protein